MFIDEVQIYVKAGDGGHGCLSFRREKFMPKGGPDGGDGGRGGHIYFVAVEDVDTLTDFTGQHHWRAQNGQSGMGQNKHGADGEDLIIKVPPGTLIIDQDIDLVLRDLTEIDQQVRVCRGGNGGRGNKRYASSRNQAPRYAKPGRPGQERNLKLELKLIADVGLLGVPNAGKSTLISRCTAARPRIADYPFTTLEPALGIVELSGYRRFVMADIPGLIEGAHQGVGLGFEFLRHIERTTVLAHILDISPVDGSDPVENYHTLRNELAQYSKTLAEKPEIVIVNKIDLRPDESVVKDIEARLGQSVQCISAVTGEGIREVNELLWQTVRNTKDTPRS